MLTTSRTAKSLLVPRVVRAFTLMLAICIGVPVFAGGLPSVTVRSLPMIVSQTAAPGGASKAAAKTGPELVAKTIVPFVAKHCAACHGVKEAEASLSLVKYQTAAEIGKARKTWLTVASMVRDGTMPPEKRPRPSPDEIDAFADAIEGTLAWIVRTAPPDPGRVTIRRLNRVEYNNTVRDLLKIDFAPAEDFPSDDVGYGFDNIGDVLSLSPVLMERYLAAAENIARRAILVGPPPKPANRHTATIFIQVKGKQAPEERRAKGIVGEGSLGINYGVSMDGDYKLRTNAFAMAGTGAPVRMAIVVDGERVTDVEVTGSRDKPQTVVWPIALKAGNHRVGFEFINHAATTPPEKSLDSLLDMEKKPQAKPLEGDKKGPPPLRALYLQHIELEGPADTTPLSHRIVMQTKTGASDDERAKEIIARLCRRAFRRPVTPTEVSRCIGLFDQVRSDGESFEAAMRFVLEAVLVSPHFLFRVELDNRPEGDAPRAISEHQLASRLSYFLWSSMPDDELSALADQGTLSKNLAAQVKRMLADPRSEALVENFGLQWLQVQTLKTFAPDPKTFPEFDEKLRQAMFKETSLFLNSIVREDRGIFDLLQADYTFLNERLARHYGIRDTAGTLVSAKNAKPAPGAEPIRGEGFVRVKTGDSGRGGVITLASVLTITSNPTRTSPVKRGRWVLEQLLGTPPPPPPPNVPELEAAKKATTSLSLRKLMEVHREKASCAACHARMDPLGFAFENFNGIGGYREFDGDFRVDPSGELPGGQKFSGPHELKSILLSKRELFAQCLAEKLMTYALGRGIEYYDAPALERVVQRLPAQQYKFSSLITHIVESDAFRMRRGKRDQP